ncbi:serine acetyltransferase [PVC group bacterium]|nr:serine acetyltransferase [PVC group bacterium]
MADKYITKKQIENIAKDILDTYGGEICISRTDGLILPNRIVVYDVLDDLFKILFPGYSGREQVCESNLADLVKNIVAAVGSKLQDEVENAYVFCKEIKKDTRATIQEASRCAVLDLLKCIPDIRESLKSDVQAAYDGDPAAKSFDEIILSYPCMEAISTYRIAHVLYKKDVPLIPRLMTERAHMRTGIDIHPGAKIGKSFFIDHGTGVVVGETTVIGDSVKIYQGVTLGALSFPKDERGRVIKGRKRHPTIENHVTIYAEATILGGETLIGHDSIIGGNVWLTKSISPWTRVEAPLEGQRIVSRKNEKSNKDHVV